ncbi:phosphatases II [Coprinopsis marcescibilis]|uniref:Phosphatases II n=1 Tax=Coprinopsis marcescibilis TaxID=230819 RepID=A0A5C3L8T4_COPMA|nr:phosphatases II [Coprinopsis marcescibilis]
MGQWKNINAIIENRLYLGNITAAISTRSLTERHITHILSVCTDEIPAELPASGITHRRIQVEDVDYANLLIHLPEACQFIDQALRSGGIVLVHCGQGLSRSAAVICAYIMWSRRVNVAQALDFVRNARDQIWINAGFHEQLVLFELCNYMPSPSNGIYQKWRYSVDARLRAAGLIR